MATFSKPTRLPTWADDDVNNVDPGVAKQDLGWATNEIPPSSWENWKGQLNGQWWKWIDERLEDGVTDDVLNVTMPLSIEGDNFVLHNAGDPRISFKGEAGNSYIEHDAGNDEIAFVLDGTEVARFKEGGASFTLEDNLFVPGVLTVGDSAFEVELVGGTEPRITFDTDDYLKFDRATSAWAFRIASVSEVLIDAQGLKVNNGVYVGDTTGTAVDNELHTEGNIHVGGKQLYFGIGSDDYITYDDTADTFTFTIDGMDEYVFGKTQLDLASNNIVNGGAIGAASFAASGNMSAANFFSSGTFGLDATTHMDISTNTLTFVTSSTDQARIPSTGGLSLAGGIVTGSVGTAASGSDIKIFGGGLSVGASSNPGSGDGIFFSGVNVGFDAIPVGSNLAIGDANFHLRLFSATEPRIYFEATTWVEYNRTANTYVFRSDGTDRYGLSATYLRPEQDKASECGDVTHRWSTSYAMQAQFHGVVAEPADNGNGLTQRNAMNCVLACGSVPSAGTSVSGNNWNLKDCTHTAGANPYVVELDKGIASDASIQITIEESGNIYAATYVRNSSTLITVHLWDDAGTRVEKAFSIAIFGRPEDAPTT